MLSNHPIGASLAAADLGRARTWYQEKLGWTPILDHPGILLYRVGSTTFGLYETPFAGTARNTVANWHAQDLAAEMSRLRANGVEFEEYDFGEYATTDGVLEDPESGFKNAWFIDSEGNTWGIVEVPDDPTAPSVKAMLATADIDRARDWYRDALGFEPKSDEMGELLVYQSGATEFSVYKTDFAGTAQNTVAIWLVDDLDAEMAELRERGVVFEEYDLREATTVDGVMTDPSGDKVAWFKDPDGNILGLSQPREPLPG